MNEPPLYLWTIYEKPRDYPDRWVVRRFSITTAGAVSDEVQLADSLDEARELIPPTRYNLGRTPNDEPQIVETWV